MKLLCLACPKNACFLLPLQSKHGVTQLLPNIYPCPKLPKIHPISPGFNTPIHGHWHRTKSRVEFCFDAFSALSRATGKPRNQKKNTSGDPPSGWGSGRWMMGGGRGLLTRGLLLPWQHVSGILRLLVEKQKQLIAGVRQQSCGGKCWQALTPERLKVKKL